MARDTVRIQMSRYPRRTPPIPRDLQLELLTRIETSVGRSERPFAITSDKLLEWWFNEAPIERTRWVARLGISRQQLDRFVHYHLTKALDKKRRELREEARRQRRSRRIPSNVLTYRIGDVISLSDFET